MSAPKRRWLRVRLIAVCMAAQALMLALVIGNGVRLADRDLIRQTENRLHQMADSLDATLVPPLAGGNLDGLRDGVLRLGRLDDVVYLTVLDAGGAPLVETGAVPQPLPDPSPEVSAGTPLAHIRVPLVQGEQGLGEVRYGLSTRFLGDARREALIQGAAIGTLAVFFSTFALVTMGVVLTARLKTLTAAVLRLGAGDGDVRLEVQGEDEVAALTQAINAAAASIGDKVGHLEASATILRASNAELQRLTATIAQRLQDPVRTTADNAQALIALMSDQVGTPARDCAAAIADGAHRADGLLTQLRNYIAIDTMPLPPDAAADLRQCALRAREELADKIAAAQATIVIDELPRAHCDGDQIATALRLLMENAIDHRGQDAPHVHIHASVDAGRVVVGVTDNGPGVPSDFRERMFELFETLDNRTNGAGVGLAVVRKIIRRHLGNVWITPAAGSGLTVNFTLPRLTPPTAA